MASDDLRTNRPSLLDLKKEMAQIKEELKEKEIEDHIENMAKETSPKRTISEMMEMKPP